MKTPAPPKRRKVPAALADNDARTDLAVAAAGVGMRD